MNKISLPAVERLCSIYGLLEKLETLGTKTISSAEMGRNINATNATVRKDISYLGMPSVAGRDYEVKKLKGHISKALQLCKPRRACIIGLGRIGSAILAYEKFKGEGFEIAAGFDISINKIERLVTPVSLFLTSDLETVIHSRNIEIGIICVPPDAAQDTADKLVAAGIKGLLNCTAAVISVPEKIILRNIDYTTYLRVISANISLNKK